MQKHCALLRLGGQDVVEVVPPAQGPRMQHAEVEAGSVWLLGGLRTRLAPVRFPRVPLRETIRHGRNLHAHVAVLEPIGTSVKRPGNTTRNYVIQAHIHHLLDRVNHIMPEQSGQHTIVLPHVKRGARTPGQNTSPWQCLGNWCVSH